MNQELFKNVPSEIVIDILSRLPVRSVISCKCVHKSWLHLVETREFEKLHLSRSVTGLTIYETIFESNTCSKFWKFFEFEDGLDVEHHDLHYKLVTKFSFTRLGSIMGSVDGLLFMCKLGGKPGDPSICNPITREYISLNCPQEFVDNKHVSVTWGFGSSKMSSKHKVVRVSHDFIQNQETHKRRETFEFECHVYTLGTGLWRRHASCPLLMHMRLNTGVFANGNLHWLVRDLDNCVRVSFFDLETEHFSTFSAPPLHQFHGVTLFALGDSLGVCDCASRGQIVIWLMKEYGVEKSWTKEFVMSDACKFAVNVYPIKVFKDGDILLSWDGLLLFYYSSKTETIKTVDMFKLNNEYHIKPILHTPSSLTQKFRPQCKLILISDRCSNVYVVCGNASALK